MNRVVRRRIYISILISLLIHLGFLVWSFFVRILPLTHEKVPQYMRVKIVKEPRAGEEALQSAVNSAPKSTPKEDLPSGMKISEPPVLTPQEVSQPAPVPQPTQPAPLVPSSAPDIARLAKPPSSETVNNEPTGRQVPKDIVAPGEIPQEDRAVSAPQLVPGPETPGQALDTSRGSVAPAALVSGGGDRDAFQVMKKGTVGIEGSLQAADVGTALTYELFKYQDPASGEKYFKLLVKVRDATANFQVIPKEVIFLADASYSIGNDRLLQFIQGIMYSLKNLNPDDRFNVVIFKDTTFVLSPEPLKPDPLNLKKALIFLSDVKVGSTTDMYNALKSTLSTKDTFTPSYRIVLSDGIPTKGVVDSRKVINEISTINNNQVAIFTFGGGVNVIRYMLEFLAYKNRGWAVFQDRGQFINRALTRMYDSIKDPLLLNLRYYISGVDDKDVFPKILPDFFKGSEFVIYGKYKDEGRIFVQVLGNVTGGRKEFTVTADLKDAAAGDKTIARQWAFHKVYYLISQLKSDANNEVLDTEIDSLCTKFDIVTPYSAAFRDKPKPPPAPPKNPAPPVPSPGPSPSPKLNFK